MEVSRRHGLKHALGGHLLETRAFFKSIATRNDAGLPPAYFIFFGRGRSGSTLLVELLDRHPQIACLGEILRFRTFAPASYIRNCMKTCAAPRRGFKLLSYQVRTLCSPAQQSSIREWMEENRVTVFHLRRENLLRHAVSNIYAARRGAYHSTDKRAARRQSIRIEPEELLHWMDGSKALLEFELAFLEGLDRFEIIYEKHLSDAERQRETYSEILAKLDLPHYPSSTTLKKVTPPDLRELIENFSEIERALSGTVHEQHLHAA